MENCAIIKQLPVQNFLNPKGIKLLEIINKNQERSCNDLIRTIEDQGLMKKSSIFRYIKCFLKFELLEKSDRKKKENGFINYKLSEEGIKTLNFFSDYICKKNRRFPK